MDFALCPQDTICGTVELKIVPNGETSLFTALFGINTSFDNAHEWYHSDADGDTLCYVFDVPEGFYSIYFSDFRGGSIDTGSFSLTRLIDGQSLLDWQPIQNRYYSRINICDAQEVNKTFYVTNLSDGFPSPPGSLRAAMDSTYMDMRR